MRLGLRIVLCLLGVLMIIDLARAGVECTTTYVPDNGEVMNPWNGQEPGMIGNQVMYISNLRGLGGASGEWVTYDVTDWGLPSTAKTLELEGVNFVGARAWAWRPCNFTIAFRRVGSTAQCNTYPVQTLTMPGEGMRPNWDHKVNLTDGKFEMCWIGRDEHMCDYGSSIRVESWCD